MRSFAAAALFALFCSALAVHVPPGSNDTSLDAAHPPDSASQHQSDSRLSPRADNARFTYYATGLGACGQENKDSDFIVAVNTDQYEGGSHCFETIVVTHNGKSAEAQIVDECPGCPWGALDMSPGLFQFFADESEGVIYGQWDFHAKATTSHRVTYEKSPNAKESSSKKEKEKEEKKEKSKAKEKKEEEKEKSSNAKHRYDRDPAVAPLEADQVLDSALDSEARPEAPPARVVNSRGRSTR